MSGNDLRLVAGGGGGRSENGERRLRRVDRRLQHRLHTKHDVLLRAGLLSSGRTDHDLLDL